MGRRKNQASRRNSKGNRRLHDRQTRHDTTRHDTTRHDTTRHDTTRHDTTRFSYEICYAEPFVGAGAVFFRIVQHYPQIRKFILNDANPDLIHLYRVVQNDVEALIESLEQLNCTFIKKNGSEREDFYYRQRDLFNAHRDLTLQRAAQLIFLNKTDYNGLYRVNRNGEFNAPFGSYAETNPLICDASTLRTANQLLKKAVLLNGDFTEVLARVEGHAIFYLDPPYRPLTKTASFTSYTRSRFNDDDQRRLRDFCRTLSEAGHRWILSNSDTQDGFFENLYAGCRIRRVLAPRAINSNAKKRGRLPELLITNRPEKEKTNDFQENLLIFET